MKLKLFLIAASAMALASCSSDEVVKNNEDANAIKFSVVANNGSRAKDYYCNYKLPGDFNVWAQVGGKTYFSEEKFTNGGSGAVYSIEGPHRYWPNEKISFWAAKNYDATTVSIGEDTGDKTMGFTTQKEAKDQLDLLYAYTTAERGIDANFNSGVANINFRHALSQVVFYAQNDNENIFVTIDEIQICNIKQKGTFKFPAEETNKNFESHDQSGDLDAKDGSNNRIYAGIGTWPSLSDVFYTTTGTFGPKSVPVKNADGSTVGKVDLTDNAAGKVTGSGESATTTPETPVVNSLLLIPQTVEAWNPGTAETKDPDASQTGAYFKVKCTIQNVAKGDGKAAAAGDIYLWGNSTATDYIYVPVEIDWAVGKKYIYTIHFTTTGHGGYDKDGNDVLIPIKFDVKVDDFAAGTDNDVNVDSGIIP